MLKFFFIISFFFFLFTFIFVCTYEYGKMLSNRQQGKLVITGRRNEKKQSKEKKGGKHTQKKCFQHFLSIYVFLRIWSVYYTFERCYFDGLTVKHQLSFTAFLWVLPAFPILSISKYVPSKGFDIYIFFIYLFIIFFYYCFFLLWLLWLWIWLLFFYSHVYAHMFSPIIIFLLSLSPHRWTQHFADVTSSALFSCPYLQSRTIFLWELSRKCSEGKKRTTTKKRRKSELDQGQCASQRNKGKTFYVSTICWTKIIFKEKALVVTVKNQLVEKIPQPLRIFWKYKKSVRQSSTIV